MEEIKYYEKNGYLYPDFALPEQTHYQIGKYGDLHLAYLKEHRRGTYSHLLTSGTLNEYLHKIDEQAHEMLNRIIDRLAAERGCDISELTIDELKSFNPVIEKDVFEVLTLEGSVKARNHLGGTAPDQVLKQVERWEKTLEND